MLKNGLLFIILLPFSFASAAQTSTKKSDDNTSTTTEITQSNNSTAYFFSQCYRNVPPIIKDNNSLPKDQIPVSINAKSIYGNQASLTYQDDVQLTQGLKTLNADKLVYFKDSDNAMAKGNINFVNGDVTLSSDSIETKLSDNQTTLENAKYQFHGQGGRGSAERVYDNGNDLYELNDSTYSACPPGDNTWSIDSTTLYIDNENGVGSAYNAVLRIKDVPVFYLPYITYPINDTRKTGVLFPTYSAGGTNGITVSQPFYINIAENMDATITSTYMQNRGTSISTEYRYLFDIGSGVLVNEYLGDDRLENESRYLYHWEHNWSLNDTWKFNAEYTKVSDDDYFTDIDTDYGSISDSELLQTAELTYTSDNWKTELEVRNFQVLSSDDDDATDTSHIVLPKLSYSLSQPLGWKSLQFDLYSEITKFDHSSDDVYTATRIHTESKLSLPLYYNALFVNTEIKYMASYYQQSIPDTDDYDYDDLDENVTRLIPSFKINAGLNFERDFALLDSQYKQTLVPQIQYLYVPYQDQSNIGIYDTAETQTDYYSLFRDNRFSGYDRIADADLLTFGMTSSILNDKGEEKVRFALGQNYYLSSSEIYVPDYYDDDDDYDYTVSGSYVIGSVDINFQSNYFLHSGLSWDTDDNKIDSANTTVEKRWQGNNYIQLSYRYVSVTDEEEEDNDYDDLVNQIGSKVNWSINSQWTTFASYYYGVKYDHDYEQNIGIKYQSCCWSLGFSYNRSMSTYDDDDDDYETEDTYRINFELTGLGGAGSRFSSDSNFDYGRPFYLQ